MPKLMSILIAMALAALMVGCNTSPREIDRTHRRPHTAMRGPAYKRLVLTFNEANNLAYRADRYAKALRDAGSVDPDSLLGAQELASDLAAFADDIEWSLTNNQRMVWHRTEMDRYWDRFLELYPEDSAYAESFTDRDMRRVTRKIQLKNQEEYRLLHEYEHPPRKWGTLFHPPGEAIYDRQIEKQKQ